MKLLQVNTVALGGSIPSYMAAIHREALRRGWTSVMAKGRRADPDGVGCIQIGSPVDTAVHGMATRIFDRHGLHGRRATERFIGRVEEYDPDIIHLHNIHGYYLHYPTLFRWLRDSGRPVVWSMHDCWAFTGHCAYYRNVGVDCTKWRTHCSACPLTSTYPKAMFDRSRRNFDDKVSAFTSVPQLRILPVSRWLDGELAQSALSVVPRTVVSLDVDIDTFSPCAPKSPARVLGVTNVWTPLKGLDFFYRLREQLDPSVEIRLVGMLKGRVPDGITYAGRTDSRRALAREYSAATILVNPTHADTFPQNNREALACGTPVVSRDIFGAVEGLCGPGSPVFAAMSDDGLLAHVRRCLAAYSDPAAMQDASAAARRVAESLYGGTPNMMRLFDVYRRAAMAR